MGIVLSMIKDSAKKELLYRFESEHQNGVTSVEVLSMLEILGIRISEPTLRKYVQLGLIPRSKRIGTRGKHQGSWGIYPPWILRQVIEIKRMLKEGKTIEQIQEGGLIIFSKCMEALSVLSEAQKILKNLENRNDIDLAKVKLLGNLISEARGLVEKAAEKALGSDDEVEIAI